VLDDPDDPVPLVRELRGGDVRACLAGGRIAGGMIPKVESALNALAWGGPEALSADGRAPERLRDALSGRQGTRFLR
jgi:acetylglutamate kinase